MGAVIPGVVQLWCEADCSPPSGAKVKNELYLHSPMCLYGMCWEDIVFVIFLYKYICQCPDNFVSSCIADCCLYVLLSMKLVGLLFFLFLMLKIKKFL